MKRQEFNEYVVNGDFSSLFNQMGWNNSNQVNPTIAIVDEQKYKLQCVSQRNGFKVYVCEVTSIPLMSVIKSIDKRLRKSSNDYILIFISSSEQLHHEWIVPVKTIDKRVLVPVEYTTTAQLEFLFSKHLDLSFDIQEESTILDVTKKVHSAFELNSEKITKDFYAGFKKQHNQFGSFISGIDVEGDKQWYVSVMLNRLMFCYFIQKKNFLDFNPNYLREKLNYCKQKQGKDKFFSSFYKSFLIQLFQGGLNTPNHEDKEFKEKFGRIPYLNGGMFDQHQIEKQYENIDIADEAFENLFDFFDKYHWHLDTRIEASGKDINPDVLGYIFEQYINDRAQMGAYYTKEDITNYIGKNCILPFLWDKTAESVDLKELWTFLKNSEDEYIYDSVKYGLKDSNGTLRELPKEIENGIDTSKENLLERRKIWNTPTEESFALPTEIWRETVERRTRYLDLADKIKKGEITQINDFITFNLDIIKFTHDVLQNTNDANLLTHFYHSMQNVTILDPTCGSGAFLFAAMNILEPLYDICLDRMEDFNKSDSTLFNTELDEIKNKYRSNREYFIYKNIILKNLYGVDIMNEATEIAKLRLFLKMVAVVEADKKLPNLGLDPLPDIDFNIRCGNTLVGYATEKEVENSFIGDALRNLHEDEVKNKIEKISNIYNQFQKYQLIQTDNLSEFKKAKISLQKEISELNDILNTRMHEGLSKPYEQWLADTKPFHWFAEYYSIIHGNGGFDIIIGNPPYVVYKEKEFKYRIDNLKTIECKDLYAYVIERSSYITNSRGTIGMIVPISIDSTDGFSSLRAFISESFTTSYYSNYAMRPSKLFEGAEKHLSIFITNNFDSKKHLFTSKYYRWSSIERNILFNKISYLEIENRHCYLDSIPKIGTGTERDILSKILTNSKMENNSITYSQYALFHTRKLRYFVQFLDCAPIIYNEDGSIRETSELKQFYYKTDDQRYAAISVYLSSLFFWFFITFSDCRNLNKREVVSFPFDLLKSANLCDLAKMGRNIVNNLQENSYYVEAYYKKYGKLSMQTFQPRLSKDIADKIDYILFNHFEFTEEELDFIQNYDIKYRMGDELNGDDE